MHRDVLDKVPNAQEIGTMLFNELMNIINGDTAITHYISQNIKRSGLETRRKLHKNNDPTTYATTDGYCRMIEQLAATRCKDEKEFAKRF